MYDKQVDVFQMAHTLAEPMSQFRNYASISRVLCTWRLGEKNAESQYLDYKLLGLAESLTKNSVLILASGGTAKMIREAGLQVE